MKIQVKKIIKLINGSKKAKFIRLLSIFLFLLSFFMLFFNRVPQIDSNLNFLSSKYVTISKPNQIYNDDLVVPIFDNKCFYSVENATLALKNNNFKEENIYIKKSKYREINYGFLNYKCWDRVIGSSYSQGTKLGKGEKIYLSYIPFPRFHFLIFSIYLLIISFSFGDRLFNKDGEFEYPFFVPKVILKYFHIFLCLFTLFQFFKWNRLLVNYSKTYNLLYVTIWIALFLLISKLIIDLKNNQGIYLISSLLIVLSYQYLIFNNLSINQIFTDWDVFQSQLPISLVQFDQIKNFGDFFTWNPHLGAGYQLEGQYANDYIIRKFIFLISPNFIFASNFYFLFHLIIAMILITLFFVDLKFSRTVSIIVSYVFLTSNQIINWQTFLHYPAFLLSLALTLYGVVVSNKNKWLSYVLIVLGFYVSATGAHVQNLVFLFMYLFVILFFFYVIKELRLLVNYQIIGPAILTSTITSIYFILPFFEVLVNVGSRSANDFSKYIALNKLINFINPRIIDNARIIDNESSFYYLYSINEQLYISSLFFLIFIFIKTKNKPIERFSLFTFLSVLLFSMNNIIQNSFMNLIPGLDFISNWQRSAPFLIFSITIYIASKLDYFLKVKNNKLVLITLLFTVCLSSTSRINAFYNNEIPHRMLNDTHNANLKLKQLNEKLSFDNYNTRIMSICNDNEHLPMTPGSTLLFNNDLYWAGLYASFPNTQYNNKFQIISSTPPGDVGGRYYTHNKRDQFFTKNINSLNIEYLIANNKNCEFEKLSLEKILETNELSVYRNADVEPIIHLGKKNGKYIIPNEIKRINPELVEITINNFKGNGYLYFNEIYSGYWNAYVDSKKVNLLNNEGFMLVKISEGNNKVILEFDNRNLQQNIKFLIQFIKDD